jgi:hypothetical protein
MGIMPGVGSFLIDAGVTSSTTARLSFKNVAFLGDKPFSFLKEGFLWGGEVEWCGIGIGVAIFKDWRFREEDCAGGEVVCRSLWCVGSEGEGAIK